MRIPKNLTGEAANYWRRHAKRLIDAGILTDADTEGFTLLCQLWERCQEMAGEAKADPKKNRTYLETCKAYQSLARQFALLPLERRRSQMDMGPTEVDEFGL